MKPHPATPLNARTASPYEHNGTVMCIDNPVSSTTTATICAMPAD